MKAKAKKKKASRPSRNPTGKGRAPGTLTSRLQMRDRYEEAEALLCRALPYGDVLKALMKTFDVQRSQAAAYVTEIYERWDSDDKADSGRARQRTVRRLLAMVDRYTEPKSTRRAKPETVLRAETLLMKVEGTAAPTKIEMTYDFNSADLSNDQLRRIAEGEDPATVIATGGRRDLEGEGEGEGEGPA